MKKEKEKREKKTKKRIENGKDKRGKGWTKSNE